jgi:hypothetical protein
MGVVNTVSNGCINKALGYILVEGVGSILDTPRHCIGVSAMHFRLCELSTRIRVLMT